MEDQKRRKKTTIEEKPEKFTQDEHAVDPKINVLNFKIAAKRAQWRRGGGGGGLRFTTFKLFFSLNKRHKETETVSLRPIIRQKTREHTAEEVAARNAAKGEDTSGGWQTSKKSADSDR